MVRWVAFGCFDARFTLKFIDTNYVLHFKNIFTVFTEGFINHLKANVWTSLI